MSSPAFDFKVDVHTTQHRGFTPEETADVAPTRLLQLVTPPYRKYRHKHTPFANTL